MKEDKLSYIKKGVIHDKITPGEQYYDDWLTLLSSYNEKIRTRFFIRGPFSEESKGYSYSYEAYIVHPDGFMDISQIVSSNSYPTRAEAIAAFERNYPWVRK